MDAMTAFLERTQSDPALAESVDRIVSENEAETIYPKIAELANGSGFSVTEADAREEHQQRLAMRDSSEPDLSDEELDGVAGGNGPIEPRLLWGALSRRSSRSSGEPAEIEINT